MDHIHAPYGFVPASPSVFIPPWAPAAAQDVPFQDGLCGRLRLRITAESPIFIRGSEDPAQFFCTPDGRFALPGTSLRGLLRNTVEIASFGWMRRVNDHRYGVRDLHNQELYVQHMAGIQDTVQGDRRPLPRVIAGWLRRATSSSDDRDPDAIVAEIIPCSFAKVEYRLLGALTGSRQDFGRRQSAVDKYRTWGDRPRQIRVAVRDLRLPNAVRLPFGFGEVTGAGPTEGTLVFTGQPSPWSAGQAPRRGGGHPKHHDFVFYGRNAAHTVTVSRRTFAGFDFVHSDRGEQGNLGRSESRNAEWHHWGSSYDRGEDVPVFFLLDEAQSTPRRPVLRAFGLAMMFRLAYDFTTGEARDNAQPPFKEKGTRELDFAETLFGHVAPERRSLEARLPALKGRVSLGLALAQGKPTPLPAVQVVLGTPKASYYPSYVEQSSEGPGLPPARDGRGKARYSTYMDLGVKLRGWKRYRPQLATVTPPRPLRGDGSAMDLSRVGTRFQPLPAGTVFEGELRVHNVRKAELGALLWALDFGGDTTCRHSLGLARPLGYGMCRMEVLAEGTDLRDMQHDPVTDLDPSRRAFAELMTDFCRKEGVVGLWEASRQIFELRALARPLPAGSIDGTHMRIDHPDDRNQFQRAKQDGYALATAGSEDDWRSAAGLRPRSAATRASAQPSSGWSMPRQDFSAELPRHRLPTPLAERPWTGLKGGSRVKVKLTGQTRKEKWKATLVDYPAEGVVSFGEPPTGAALDQEHTVTVTAGGNPRDIQMKWE